MSTHPTDPTGRASDAELATWAEHDMVLAKDSPTALRGEAAAAYGRALLENALGGPEAVQRAVGGRPPLDPGAEPGRHARKRQVRLPADLDAALDTLAAAQQRRASDVLRDALTDYVATHPAAS